MIMTAAWVVPVARPPIRDGFVEIAGERIIKLGERRDLPARAMDCVDLGEAALLPGLVNPHTHLELSGYAGLLPPMDFWSWIYNMLRLRAESDQRRSEQVGVRVGAWQSLRAGVTCVGDISRGNWSWPILRNIPIRKVCFVELLSLADLPPRNPAELRRAAREIIEDELLTAGVSPHAPYTVPREHLCEAAALAEELRRPWTMHLAETREEIAFLSGQRGALPPALEKLLDKHRLRSPNCTPGKLVADCARCPGSLAHGNYLETGDIALLAERGHAVIYCPRSHRYFGHSPHPWRALREAGVTVAIGTDSLASNKSLSMLDELNFIHTQVADPPRPCELLKMATLDAARALNLEDRIGTLEAGKEADLAAFACPAEVDDPVRALIEKPGTALAVWIRGHRIRFPAATDYTGSGFGSRGV